MKKSLTRLEHVSRAGSEERRVLVFQASLSEQFKELLSTAGWDPIYRHIALVLIAL